MISFIQFLSNKVLGTNKVIVEEDDLSQIDEYENLLAEIRDIRQDTVRHDEPQTNLPENEDGCFYKDGIVTQINQKYVVIENKYMCELPFVQPDGLKEGDKVYYLAYRKPNSEDELKVRKILHKYDIDQWEPNDQVPLQQSVDKNNEVSFEHPVITKSDQVIERRQALKRTVIGKVARRNGREVFLEDDTCINLDQVGSEFIPVVGDGVKLECLVEVDHEVANFRGEILEVEAIAPLRQITKIGKVTEYSDLTDSGVIDKTIVFSKHVCEMPGYIPCVDDKVYVQAIESDQGIQKHWRAVTVSPIEDVSIRYDTATVKHKPPFSKEEIEELVQDKDNVEITNDIVVTLDAKAETNIEIKLKNNGNAKQKIFSCSLSTKYENSQLRLLSPKKDEPQHLWPASEVSYKIQVRARFVGVSEEMIIFKFPKFRIGRIIRIVVNSLNPVKESASEIIVGPYDRNSQSVVIPQHVEEGFYIRGIKPYKPAKFIVNRPVTWVIPQKMWDAIDKIVKEKRTRDEAYLLLQEKAPVLEKPLSFEIYKQRFDHLLYLEEIGQILELQKYSMSSATMHRAGEYLTLNVPGLAENRPSLIIGDRVIISFKWDATGGKKKYEGYIHKIRSSDVFLKFDPKFHDDYHNEDCQVEFKGSTTVISRGHTAIQCVVSRLGSDVLFPRRVIEKKPQYNFVDDADDIEEETIDPACMDREKMVKAIEARISKRRINWFNKRLNVYQKNAVKNVLKGIARPLPYVIFGPPGTGKTITVCEAILQMFFTVTESRILVATPSNSSANLIAERLLDSKRLHPGDLVRFVAHHYIESDAIPEQLLPYCVTGDISSEGSRANVNLNDPRGFKTNLTLSVLIQHRIIIGTCSALGLIHNMGVKPGHFTHIIIDEAGQASEPEIMIPLSLGHRDSTQIVLAGDPKQLGPITQSQYAGYFGLAESFLVRLLQQFPYQRDPIGFETGYDPRLVTKLLMNYRSLPELLKLPNQLFYESELIPQIDPETSEEAILLQSLSEILPRRLGAPPPLIFHGVNGKNAQEQDSPSWYNAEEATQIYMYLIELYNNGLTPDDIGVITPYSKQVHYIRRLLLEMETEFPKIGSVEEFQGQERKVIILSTVRTAEERVKDDVRHSLGFVAAKERLNVAITRARALLIIIGQPDLLYQDVYWRSVLDHCQKMNSWLGNRPNNLPKTSPKFEAP